jgi:hypothetical protein
VILEHQGNDLNATFTLANTLPPTGEFTLAVRARRDHQIPGQVGQQRVRHPHFDLASRFAALSAFQCVI